MHVATSGETLRVISSSCGLRLCISCLHALPINSTLVFCSSLRCSARTFEEKRDCSQSMSSTKKFACTVREQLFVYCLDCDKPFLINDILVFFFTL